MQLGEQERRFHLLIRDRDAKFPHAFDDVFRSEGIEVIRTPVQAPNANAFAERWVRTVRSDCLDRILILGRRHLDRVLRVYTKPRVHKFGHGDLRGDPGSQPTGSAQRPLHARQTSATTAGSASSRRRRCARG
jgi:transposase InsO family protein